MIALGLEDHVIACYGLDNPVKPGMGGRTSENELPGRRLCADKESVTMMEPDMIFTWGSLFSEKRLGDQKEWIKNGVNPYINTNTRRGGHNRTLENEYTDLLNIGKIFQVEEKAQAIVDNMKAEIDNVLAQNAGKEPPRVSVIEFLGDNITNYGASSLGGNMVRSPRHLDTSGYRPSGQEDVVALDPDVIFRHGRTENVEAEKWPWCWMIILLPTEGRQEKTRYTASC